MNALEIAGLVFLTELAIIIFLAFQKFNITLKLLESILEKMGAIPVEKQADIPETQFLKDAQILEGDEHKVEEFEEVVLEKGKVKPKEKTAVEV